MFELNVTEILWKRFLLLFLLLLGLMEEKRSDVSCPGSSVELLGSRGDSANKRNSCLGFDHAAVNFVSVCIVTPLSVSVMTTCPSGGNLII